MKQNRSTYWTLFCSTFQLSAFTFGGGFVIVPLMRKKFVHKLQWIDEEEMLDLTAIAQSCPGPIAVNASILVGYRVAGVPGALVTMLGTVLPPLIIISIISLFYIAFRDNLVVSLVMRGMLAGVAAVICDVVLSMAGNILRLRDLISIVVLVGAFCAVRFWGVNIILIILICGVLGALRQTLYPPKSREKGELEP